MKAEVKVHTNVYTNICTHNGYVYTNGCNARDGLCALAFRHICETHIGRLV